MAARRYRLWEWNPRNRTWLKKASGTAACMKLMQMSLRENAIKSQIDQFATCVLPVRYRPESDPESMGVRVLTAYDFVLSTGCLFHLGPVAMPGCTICAKPAADTLATCRTT